MTREELSRVSYKYADCLTCTLDELCDKKTCPKQAGFVAGAKWQTEQDREKAIKAYCKTCDCGHKDRQEEPWIGCSVIEQFLEVYDNN